MKRNEIIAGLENAIYAPASTSVVAYKTLMSEAQNMLMDNQWWPADIFKPDKDVRVVCCTVNKKNEKNYVLGYYDGSRWCCGMNSNVVVWRRIEPYEETDCETR